MDGPISAEYATFYTSVEREVWSNENIIRSEKERNIHELVFRKIKSAIMQGEYSSHVLVLFVNFLYNENVIPEPPVTAERLRIQRGGSKRTKEILWANEFLLSRVPTIISGLDGYLEYRLKKGYEPDHMQYDIQYGEESLDSMGRPIIAPIFACERVSVDVWPQYQLEEAASTANFSIKIDKFLVGELDFSSPIAKIAAFFELRGFTVTYSSNPIIFDQGDWGLTVHRIHVSW